MHTASGTTSYTYWPDGLVASIQYPNGIVADSSYADSYDAAGRLTDLVNHTGSVGSDPADTSAQFVSSFHYTYDPDGDRTSQVEAHAWPSGLVVETTDYSYDKLDRLTSVQYVSNQNGVNAALSYSYDDNGNRLSETGTDPQDPSQQVKLTYAYNRLNELVSVTDAINPSQSMAYTYDANGNRTQETIGAETTTTDGNGNPVVTEGTIASVTPYFYNVLDELVKTTEGPGGGVVTYNYDYMGMRDEASDSSGDIGYLYDGAENLVLEYNGGTGQTIFKYNYGLGLISTWDPTNLELFYLSDVLGSTSEVTNLSGTVIQGFQYDAWGNEIDSFGNAITTVGFTGQLADLQTGLDYFGSRYYDPSTGTFITQDDYQGEVDLPISLNRYLYAYANPLRYTDPTGHDPAPNSDTSTSSASTAAPSSSFQWNISDAGSSAANGTQGPVSAATSPDGSSVVFLTPDDVRAVQEMMNKPAPVTNGVDINTGIIYSQGEAVGRVHSTDDRSEQALKYDIDMTRDTGAPMAWDVAPDSGTVVPDDYDFYAEFAEKVALVGHVLNPTVFQTGGMNEIRASAQAADTVFGTAMALASVGNGAAAPPPKVVGLPPDMWRDFFTEDFFPSEGELGIGEGMEKEPSPGPQAVEMEMMLRPAANLLKQLGLKYLGPKSAVTAADAAIIQRCLDEVGAEMGIRDTDPSNAYVTRMLTELNAAGVINTPAKEESDKGKSYSGVAWNPVKEIVQQADLDVADVRDIATGDFYTNDEVLGLLDYINFRLVEAGRSVQFMHGAATTASPIMGGYVSDKVYEKYCNPGPVSRFEEGGFAQYSASKYRDFMIQEMAPQMKLDPNKLYLPVWAEALPKPKLEGATSGSGSENPSTLTISTAAAMAADAEEVWESVVPTAEPPTISVALENLPGSELGQVNITAFGASGLPSAATIYLSPNAAGVGWYVDPAPLNPSEFTAQIAPDAYAATSSSPAANEYDLFTALLHEEGHVFGFDTEIRGFALRLARLPAPSCLSRPGSRQR